MDFKKGAINLHTILTYRGEKSLIAGKVVQVIKINLFCLVEGGINKS
jgi:hypothetical protein